MQLGVFLQEIIEIFNKHLSSLTKMTRTLNQMISITNEIVRLVNNFTINNYDKLKNKLKLYDEKYNEIFYNNSNRYIKDDINKIFGIIQKYKYPELYNYDEIDIRYIEFQNSIIKEDNANDGIFSVINRFADLKKNNDSNQKKEKAYNHQKYYFNISFISDNIIDFNLEDKNQLIPQISEALYKNKDTLLVSNDKRNCLNNIIKSPQFNQIIDSNIEQTEMITEIKKQNEIKIILDIIDFINKEKIDYLGNSLNFNSNLNLKRGKETYDPPYNWIGLGLKVLGKYEDDEWIKNKNEDSEWAIGFHPVKSLESLNGILTEGLIAGEYQYNQNDNNIRNSGENIGIGVYLFPEIKTAEENAKIVIIKNKTYKIVIMSRVKISEIKQPDDINYWIVSPEFIRNYRLLIKEINVT